MAISIKGIFGSGAIRIEGLKATAFDYTTIDIEYKVLDADLEKCKHFLHINGETKEITSNVNNVGGKFKYKIENLKYNTNYNIQIEIREDEIFTISSGINQSTKRYLIYGVAVDETNSNPESSVTYIEDAVGIAPASSRGYNGWADKFIFAKNRLVGLKNGAVTKEINPLKKTHYKDGSTVPIDVDVMSEIPKVYWKFDQTERGYELRVSEGKFEGSNCYAHRVGSIEKDNIYVATYLGSVEGNKLRSKSGVAPMVNTTLTQFRNYAHNVGRGYEQFNWFTLILLQNLYLLAFKNRDSQRTLGMGVCNSSKTNTGGTNTKGMLYGSSSQSEQVCFLGIEDFYGNCRQWVDGMYCDSSYNITVTPDNKNFNDSGSGFKTVGRRSYLNGGYLTKVAHTNEGGFFPMAINGSDSTQYCDYGYVSSGCFGGFGGDWGDGSSVGAFCLSVHYSASDSISGLGSRLVYLGE